MDSGKSGDSPVVFRILGSLEVGAGNERLRLGGPKPQAVLSALLIDRGRAVTTERLIEAIWAERPPSTAKALVQTYVSALRQALRAAGGEGLIVTTRWGYVADVPPSAIDRDEFERLVQQGRQAVTEKRPDDAMADFREALSLWRGPAFGATDNPHFVGEATRLDELRIDVVEEAVSVALAVGRATGVAGDLARLVEQFPARERLLGLLMTVLHRQGRRADALAAYRAGRKVLLDELGIEPGAELDAIHLAVLRDNRPHHDTHVPKLPRPAAVQRARTIERPGQLPAVPADFTGRTAEVAAIATALTTAPTVPAVPVHIVTGPAGSGKTTLAARAAHEVAGEFSDGQMFAVLRHPDGSPVAPVEILGRLLTSLGVDPSTLPDGAEDRAGRFRTLTTGRRLLLFLDDAADEQQLEALLPGSPTCSVLATSRFRFTGLAGAGRTELGALPVQAAVELLSVVAGKERTRAEPGAALRIVAACEWLPLGIRLAGARIAAQPGWTLAAFAERLADEGRRLDQLAVGNRSVRASLERSLRVLTPAALRGLRRLGARGPMPIAAEAVGVVLGLPESQASTIVDELVDVHLLEVESRSSAYRIGDLERLYLAEIERPVELRQAS